MKTFRQLIESIELVEDVTKAAPMIDKWLSGGSATANEVMSHVKSGKSSDRASFSRNFETLVKKELKLPSSAVGEIEDDIDFAAEECADKMKTFKKYDDNYEACYQIFKAFE